MPGSTGPDLNTFTIPEVELGDTFNYWRDTTNTAIYKLNKLRIYDAVGSQGIGVTYGSTGAWQAFIQPTITSGHTFTALIALSGGITAAYAFVGGGVTVGGNLSVSGGTTISSTLSVGGIANFASGLLYVSTSNSRVGIGTSSPGASLDVRGTMNVGYNTNGNILGVSGFVVMSRQSGLLFHDADDSNYVGFRAPSTVPSNVIWTLPATDGANGHVLSTNAAGTLSWKAADGVTGTDTQVQYNQGGAPGATSSFLFHYSSAAGYSAGTLGVSGGAYVLGNVGIGVTGQNIGRRIIHGTGANTARGKLEVVGDIRIPSGGFFVNSDITVPAGVCGSIGSTENAIMSGTLTIASGATLTVESGGSLIVL